MDIDKDPLGVIVAALVALGTLVVGLVVIAGALKALFS